LTFNRTPIRNVRHLGKNDEIGYSFKQEMRIQRIKCNTDNRILDWQFIMTSFTISASPLISSSGENDSWALHLCTSNSKLHT